MSFQYNLGSDTLCCVQDSYLFYLFASIQLWASFKCSFHFTLCWFGRHRWTKAPRALPPCAIKVLIWLAHVFILKASASKMPLMVNTNPFFCRMNRQDVVYRHANVTLWACCNPIPAWIHILILNHISQCISWTKYTCIQNVSQALPVYMP